METEQIPEGMPFIQPSKFQEPARYTNHTQMITMGEFAILEFRAMIPGEYSKIQQGQEMLMLLDTEHVPPHTRVLYSQKELIELRDMLNRNFPNAE
jgi:hypothetical protein